MSRALPNGAMAALASRRDNDIAAALADLRRGAAAIDLLWSEVGQSAGLGSLALALGEASHAVHKALVALDDPAVQVAPAHLRQHSPGIDLDGPIVPATGPRRQPSAPSRTRNL